MTYELGDVIASDDGEVFLVVETLHGYAIDAFGARWQIDTIEGVHRVAVIDPEDREQVKRLTSAIYGVAYPFAQRVNDMQAALREYADPKPPKPEEPKGRFAEVEDVYGVHWFRLYAETEHVTSNPWAPEHQFSIRDTWADWTDIEAVRVLNAGREE